MEMFQRPQRPPVCVGGDPGLGCTRREGALDRLRATALPWFLRLMASIHFHRGGSGTLGSYAAEGSFGWPFGCTGTQEW